MRKLLLSIRPKFVDRIFDGTKRFEFRKVKCRGDVTTILIYETSPVMEVVGEAKIKSILIGSPEDIWDRTSAYAGIDKESFDEYYHGRNTAVAYELGKIRRFEKPKRLIDYGITRAPQSFVYVTNGAS